jgi:hypothetical protein
MEYGGVMEKLERLLCEDDRLELFNRRFHEIIERNNKNADYCLLGGGVVRLEELKRLTDKVGIGTLDFYRKETDPESGRVIGRCVKIPSKDTLLLIGVCLELESKEMSELLRSAGYGTYIKNLKEFIIYCGLNNIVSIDEIRGKLLKYGYREQDALMNVEYGGEKDAVRDFARNFEALCDRKGLDRRKVLEQASLISPKIGAEKNKYYLNAFYGVKAVKIRLSCGQVKRLCASLRLTKEEIVGYVDFLDDAGIISREDRLRLGRSLRDDGFGITEIQATEFPQVDRQSVLTQQISTRMERLSWEDLDAYVGETFDSIRSFAIFYEQVLQYEGYKNVLEFCREFALSEKSHYNYVAGITIPEPIPLTVVSFLMKKMTLHIYNTMMKKAGKLSFNIEEDSAVFVLATEILSGKQKDECLFGRLFDCAELLLRRFQSEACRKIGELEDLVAELRRLVARNLVAFEEKRKITAAAINAVANDAGAIPAGAIDDPLKRFSEKGRADPETPFYDMLDTHISSWKQKDRQEFMRLLTEKFGFTPDSRLLTCICSGKQREERV